MRNGSVVSARVGWRAPAPSVVHAGNRPALSGRSHHRGKCGHHRDEHNEQRQQYDDTAVHP
jgi:hypothetical protein